MKKILLASFLFASAHVMAADIQTDSVLLQALDKTTGRTSFLTVKIGESYSYADLKIRVDKCLKRPPEETPENSAFINVADEVGQEIFRGWMFSSNPALSGMEHPVYDIWVVECKDKDVVPVQPIVSNVDISDEEVNIEDLED